jgi:hypothetical protein
MAQGMSPVALARARKERMARAASNHSRHLHGVFNPDLAKVFPFHAHRQRLPQPNARRGFDPTLYIFVEPSGAEVVATRTAFARAHPEINAGSLHDLVKGAVRMTKGCRCLGRVGEVLPTD